MQYYKVTLLLLLIEHKNLQILSRKESLVIYNAVKCNFYQVTGEGFVLVMLQFACWLLALFYRRIGWHRGITEASQPIDQ